MKKKTSNLAVDAGCLTLEERILRSDLTDQDKIEIIKIIGRQGGGSNLPGWTTTSTPYNPPQVYYTCCCCEE